MAFPGRQQKWHQAMVFNEFVREPRQSSSSLHQKNQTGRGNRRLESNAALVPLTAITSAAPETGSERSRLGQASEHRSCVRTFRSEVAAAGAQQTRPFLTTFKMCKAR